jgi:flagellar biosynthesis protein FlhA
MLDPDRLLAIGTPGNPPAIEGVTTTDPAFGLPARWIAPERAEEAREAGLRVVEPVEAMTTHLGEIVASEAAMLVTRPVTTALLDQVRARQPGLIEELVPATLTVADVQRVFQNLIGEGVSIGNADLILEHLADLARTQRDAGELTELVRQRIAHAICHQLRGNHDDLAVLSLDPRIENQIAAQLGGAAPGALPIEPGLAERLVRRLSAMADAMLNDRRAPVLLCGAELRRHLRGFTRRSIPGLAILSVAEVPPRVTLRSYDIVRLEP